MSDTAIGQEIGNYQVVSLLGQGGMGKVYKAQHPFIGKQVAIKLLKKDLCEDPETVQRFFQEARAVNDIHHDNVIDILDFGRTSEGDYFILMELLEGRSLTALIQEEAPLPLERLGRVALQICSALDAAHRKSIIHRDLKSDNIFLVQRNTIRDFVKVLDFGIAKLLDDPASKAHTTTGTVLGTPLYMAPEQALGRALDAQTDVYALGVILFQMATGTVPFFNANPVALATMHVTTKPPKPRERYAEVDPRLEKIILRCLEKEKRDRYLSMLDVGQALSSVCSVPLGAYFSDEQVSDPEPARAKLVDTRQLGLLSRRSSFGWVLGGIAALTGAVVLSQSVFAPSGDEGALLVAKPSALPEPAEPALASPGAAPAVLLSAPVSAPSSQEAPSTQEVSPETQEVVSTPEDVGASSAKEKKSKKSREPKPKNRDKQTGGPAASPKKKPTGPIENKTMNPFKD
jgi:serine/threonine-protein kinase